MTREIDLLASHKLHALNRLGTCVANKHSSITPPANFYLQTANHARVNAVIYLASCIAKAAYITRNILS